MSVTHGRTLYLAVTTPTSGSVTLSSTTQEVNGLPGSQDLGDITVAGNIGHTSLPGLQKTTFSTKHVFDDAASQSWATLGGYMALQTTATSYWAVVFGPRGTTSGAAKITLNAFITSIDMPIKVTDPNTMTVNWEMNAGTSGVTATTFA